MSLKGGRFAAVECVEVREQEDDHLAKRVLTVVNHTKRFLTKIEQLKQRNAFLRTKSSTRLGMKKGPTRRFTNNFAPSPNAVVHPLPLPIPDREKCASIHTFPSDISSMPFDG
jgi:hypothetical protein